MGTIKSGQLEKQGGFLWKGWKPKHCVLYHDGEFAIYEHAAHSNAEFRIDMKRDVIKKIEIGFECGSINLPSGRSDTEALFGIKTHNKTYHLLAEDFRDCREWVGLLENARTSIQGAKVPLAPAAPPPYAPPVEYTQPVRGMQGGGGIAPAHMPVQQYQQQPMAMGAPAPGYGQPMYAPQPGYGQPMMQQPMMQQPMYGPQPVYGQPMYGQPVYVTQSPRMQQVQQQQQQPRDNSTRNMLLAGGGGLVGGYLLGSALSEGMHHHNTDYSGGHGGGSSGFDHGAFDDGGFDF